jgi:hypothetical protein
VIDLPYGTNRALWRSGTDAARQNIALSWGDGNGSGRRESNPHDQLGRSVMPGPGLHRSADLAGCKGKCSLATDKWLRLAALCGPFMAHAESASLAS